MFVHVVLFKIKEKDKIGFVAEVLKSMENNIPQIKELEVGINEISEDRNYDVILQTRFDSREDMDAYQISTYHVEKVLNVIRPLIEKSVAGDYTV